MKNIPRPEFPDPQFRRENWLNLNGEWEFEIDYENEGAEKRYYERESLAGKIIVPFAPESDLSGVGHKGFMDAVWYRRKLDIPKSFAGKRVVLHFGAVDHKANIYVNGKYVGSHVGGYVPFAFDITDFLGGKDNYVTVHAEDDLRGGKYGYGKQSSRLESYACSYTRTTGIWQTVWMEAVEPMHIDFFRLEPNIDTCELTIDLNAMLAGEAELTAEATYGGKAVGARTVAMTSGHTVFALKLSELHLWEVGKGELYDLKLTLKEGGKAVDEVFTYFGMRSVALKDGKFLLNGRPVFGRFVLDQGFYPDGIYTAPDVSRFEQDIRLATELGFNGARFHEKVFEPLAIYAADKAGYMIWDEYPDWGVQVNDFTCLDELIPDWLAEVKRDRNHPSIIGWCCLNETWDRGERHLRQDDRLLSVLWSVVKSLDNTRPVIDTSGNFHVVTDMFDIHWYEQDPARFAEGFAAAGGRYVNHTDRQKDNGTPYWVSEYGGIKFPGEGDGWGYGNAPKDRNDFLARYKGLTDVLLDDPECCALCYTQLYDVEQEQNGLYRYDRSDKLTKEEKEFIRSVTARKAAVED